jgi:hypothetical protein
VFPSFVFGKEKVTKSTLQKKKLTATLSLLGLASGFTPFL